MTAPAGTEIPTHPAAGPVGRHCRDRGTAVTARGEATGPEAGHRPGLPTGGSAAAGTAGEGAAGR
jgi:hypothetical protein